MARKKKRNLSSEIKNHQNNLKNQQDLASRLDDGVETSVVDQYAAPNDGDFLASDIPETKAEEQRGLENTTVQADDSLEGKTVSQPVAEGDVEAQTDAAVADGKTAPEPVETVGQEEAQKETPVKTKSFSGVETSVVDQYGAPNVNDMLHSDISETQAEADRGLANTSVQADDVLYADSLEQHIAEGDVFAETNAAVAAGETQAHPDQTVGEAEEGLNSSLETENTQSAPKQSGAKGVSTSVVNQYGAPNMNDMLRSDISETQAEADRGLDNTSVQADDVLYADSLEQHIAEGDVFAETNAAVAAGTTAPHPGQTVGEAEAGLNSSLETETENTQSTPKQSGAKGVSTSVVNQYGAPNMNDMLRSDISETQAQADRGLANTSVQADDVLYADSLEQHIAEGDVFAETNAAVAAGTTAPHPGQTVGEAEAGLNSSLETETENTQSAPKQSVAKGVSTSVVNQYGAPNMNDMLRSDISETQAQADRGLANTSVQADDVLYADSLEQHVAEGDVFAETNAAVAAGTTAPHPGQTVGEAEAGLNSSLEPEAGEEGSDPKQSAAKGVSTSVVNQYGAPNMNDMLSSDIPETQAQADRGLANTSVQADDVLYADSLEQHIAEGDVFAETNAAVAAGATAPTPAESVGEKLNPEVLEGESASIYSKEGQPTAKGVSTSVVNKYGAPNMNDMLRSDIPETQAQANRGLDNTSVQADDVFYADSLEQHIAEGDVFAETNAAVNAGVTKPKPESTVGQEEDDIPDDMKLSPDQVDKLFSEPVNNVNIEIEAKEANINVEKVEEEKKYNPSNHAVEKDLPIYLL